MFNQITNFLLRIIIWIAGLFVSLITYPVYQWLRPVIPNIDSYLQQMLTFFGNYVFQGVAFAREVFFNITGYPRPLFYALCTFFLAKLAFRLLALVFWFLINIYRIIRGTATTKGS